MIFPWRLRRRGSKSKRRQGAAGKNRNDGFSDMELMTMIPNHFRCPISLDLMKDPVTLSTGITYDRENIEKWIEDGNQTCPVTNQVLRSFDQIPNHSIRKMIQEWCVENKSFGIERIPTPRIPVTPYEVSEICSDISAATALGDASRCRELVSKIKNLARESERNKKRIKENGVGLVLSASFEAFSGSNNNNNYEELLKDLLSTITWMFPLGAEGQSKIGSEKSLRTIAWFLNGEDLSTRQHAVTVLKELLAADNSYANILLEIEADNIINIPEALFKIIKFPICPKATKASLMVIYYIMLWLSSSSTTSDNKTVSKFLDTGLVSLLIEMIVDAEKNVSEKALGVLDVITNWEEGKEKVHGNALAMPLMVKKILRVSDLATEFSISILWKLCKGGGGELDQDHHEHDQSRVIIEAMQVGAFQKLLVILQVGCGEKTKEKTTELLKLMNLYKDRVDCVDSSTGFKYIKKTF